MELFQQREDCCGCSACYAVCRDLTGAITMVPDEEGFLYPVVDDKICIQCHRCIMVCPFKDTYWYNQRLESERWEKKRMQDKERYVPRYTGV